MSFPKIKLALFVATILLPWLVFSGILGSFSGSNNLSSPNNNSELIQKDSEPLFKYFDRNELINSSFYSYNDIKKLGHKNHFWYTNPTWRKIFLTEPEKIEKIVNKYLYFDENNFENKKNESIENLKNFFKKEIEKTKKNGDPFNSLSIKPSADGFSHFFLNNLLIIKNYEQYVSLFTKFELKSDFLNRKISDDFFKDQFLLVYINEKSGAPIFKKTSVDLDLNPINIISNKTKTNFLLSISEKLNSYADKTKKLTSASWRDQGFQVFYKYIPKTDLYKLSNISSLNISEIEDLLIFNRVDKKTKLFDHFIDFLAKKQTILKNRKLQKSRLYGSIKTGSNFLPQNLYSNFEQVKELINNESIIKNWDWFDTFHISNLFIPSKTDNQTEKFNKFILKKQDSSLIFDDQILYWEPDQKTKKIVVYTYNYKDLFPSLATEPNDFSPGNLVKFTKINIGDTDFQDFEFRKIKSMNKFISLYNKIIG
ncbi:hypothetical protein [Mesomycoplasma dispar]|nr:hypothetical protein [Mesomycoplasma dispar]AJR12565.1 hypothetical protein MDIS_02485 [Mesomycoplasma dispar]